LICSKRIRFCALFPGRGGGGLCLFFVSSDAAAARLRVDLPGLIAALNSFASSSTASAETKRHALGSAIVTMWFLRLSCVSMICVVFLALDQILGVW